MDVVLSFCSLYFYSHHVTVLSLCYSALELRLEAPLQTVMLLSLVGTNCVVGNQWYTMVQVNLDKMSTMIKGKI